MKNCKFIILVTFWTVIMMAFTCRAYSAELDTNPEELDLVIDTNNQTLLEKYDFEQFSSQKELREKYLKEVRKKYYCPDENFLDIDTYNFLQDFGYEVLSDDGITVMVYKNDILYTYNFPILLEGEDAIELCFLSNKGSLWSKKIVGGSDVECLGNIHASVYESNDIIQSDKTFAITYNSTTGSVKTWQFGSIIKETYVPEGSIYTGFSASEGLIFQKENDVYAVRKFGYFRNDEIDVEVIAHKVHMVIVTDYSSDNCYSAPLFIMTDGSVKFYCKAEDVQADDEKNLQQLISDENK